MKPRQETRNHCLPNVKVFRETLLSRIVLEPIRPVCEGISKLLDGVDLFAILQTGMSYINVYVSCTLW